jgi:fatty acid desaturase
MRIRVNPTVLLFLAVVTLFAGVLTLAIACPHPGWMLITGAILLQGIAFCAAYTVAHDAAHHVASPRRLLNELMLITCGVLFLFEPYLFRRLHLTHHAHTDEADDPDLFTAGPNVFIRALRSAIIHAGYYFHALRHWGHEARWRTHLLAGAALPLAVAPTFYIAGGGMAFLYAWLVPLLLSSTLLGFLISSAPHDAHSHTTRNLNLPRILRWLLGNGHLHLAHHLAPTVPWYRLPAFWRQYERTITAAPGAG